MKKILNLSVLLTLATATLASADKLTPEQAGVLNKVEPFVEAETVEGEKKKPYPTSVNCQITDVVAEPTEGTDTDIPTNCDE